MGRKLSLGLARKGRRGSPSPETVASPSLLALSSRGRSGLSSVASGVPSSAGKSSADEVMVDRIAARAVSAATAADGPAAAAPMHRLPSKATSADGTAAGTVETAERLQDAEVATSPKQRRGLKSLLSLRRGGRRSPATPSLPEEDERDEAEATEEISETREEAPARQKKNKKHRPLQERLAELDLAAARARAEAEAGETLRVEPRPTGACVALGAPAWVGLAELALCAGGGPEKRERGAERVSQQLFWE